MTLLEYAKQFHNFDIFLTLVDDAGLTDQEIMDKFEVSKQRIYNARKQTDILMAALENIIPKRDNRDPDVQLIVDTFMECFGTTRVSPYDRYAAKRLHIRHQARVVSDIIKALAHHAGEQYCPTVNSVSDLEKKLPSIMSFLKKQQTNTLVIDL